MFPFTFRYLAGGLRMCSPAVTFRSRRVLEAERAEAKLDQSPLLGLWGQVLKFVAEGSYMLFCAFHVALKPAPPPPRGCTGGHDIRCLDSLAGLPDGCRQLLPGRLTPCWPSCIPLIRSASTCLPSLGLGCHHVESILHLLST